MKCHFIQLILSPGVRTNFTCDDLLFSMLPHEKKGDAQKYIRTAIVDLHQSVFSYMRLTFGEYVADLCEKFNTKPASVIATAVAWHTGRRSGGTDENYSNSKPETRDVRPTM